jgi:hypothetical protein
VVGSLMPPDRSQHPTGPFRRDATLGT